MAVCLRDFGVASFSQSPCVGDFALRELKSLERKVVKARKIADALSKKAEKRPRQG